MELETLSIDLVEFGLTVYDAPYRASHNYPVEFDTFVDSNADGTDAFLRKPTAASPSPSRGVDDQSNRHNFYT